MTRRPWSVEEEDHLRTLAQSGASIRDIAIALGRTTSVVRRHSLMLEVSIASDRRRLAMIERLSRKVKTN